MRVLVDTTIWSAALRRDDSKELVIRNQLANLIKDGLVEIIGPIRQEILSGIRERSQFEQLKDRLSAFVDLTITTEDYEEAAAYYNLCRSKGIQGSGTDLLICAVSIRNDLAIFTSDKDFVEYAKALPIRLERLPKENSD